GLVIWAAGGGSDATKPSKAQAPSTSAPRTTPPAPTAATELAALTSDVNAGMASGSIASATGQAVTSDARQAISATGAGNRTEAATDLRRAMQTVASGVSSGSLTSAEAGLLRASLSGLAAALGLSATALTPSTAVSPPTLGSDDPTRAPHRPEPPQP